MSAGARLGSAALVLALVAALTAPSWGSDGGDTTPVAETSVNGGVINVYSFRGRGGSPIRGLVTTQFRGNRRSGRVGVSLHGLPVSTEASSGGFLVAAVSKTCAQAVDAADFVVWRRQISINQTGEGAAFSWGVTQTGVRRPPASARSVRVYDTDEAGERTELACASGDTAGAR